jgi:hypothetical protein
MLCPNGHHLLSRALLAASLAVISGCGAQQRAAERLIDPLLRSQGVLVERQTGGRELALGRYRVEQQRVEDQTFDGTGQLAPGTDGRTRPTSQLRLEFTLAGGATPWTADCVGQRRQPPDHDLAAAADEQREEVAVHCQISQVSQISGEQQRWVLAIDGNLGANLIGELTQVGAPEGTAKIVEIVMWHRVLNVSRRRLPASLGLIRSQAGAEAALILDKPERAWLARTLDDTQRELALTSLLALRLLPLGFDA